MSADKRSLSGFTNKEHFPGHIDEDQNRYEFPMLYKLNNNGKPRQWAMYCRLIKEDSMDINATKTQNWNMLAENEVRMKPEYIPDGAKVPTGTIAQIWSETGVMGMKISRSAPTYITVPKNLGKKNERNVLQQAMVTIRSKFLKKIDDGSILELDNVSEEPDIQASTKFYPMLAKKYDVLAKSGKIKYPMYAQPKLDGNRCVVFLDSIIKPTYKNVVMYTRSKKELPYNAVNDNIRRALLQLLIDNYKKAESLFLDGELYLHSKSLQDIGSDVRGQSGDKNSIQYWIYDHFYPSYNKEPFSERVETLQRIYTNLDAKFKETIVLVETQMVNNEKECDELYTQFLSDKYEGMMLRTVDGSYLKSATIKSEQLRSKDLLKRKETYDEEFEVVDFKQGDNGKEVGAVIWICEAKNPDKTEFRATPNLPIKERYEIYKDCIKHFATKYQGRLMTVEFRGLSNNNIPLQAKAVGFRDIA